MSCSSWHAPRSSEGCSNAIRLLCILLVSSEVRTPNCEVFEFLKFVSGNECLRVLHINSSIYMGIE